MVHESVYDEVKTRLAKAYAQVRIGSPFEEGVLCGPLHRPESVTLFQRTLKEAHEQGGVIVHGGSVLEDNFVTPTIVEIDPISAVCQSEAFVPILYLSKIKVG